MNRLGDLFIQKFSSLIRDVLRQLLRDEHSVNVCDDVITDPQSQAKQHTIFSCQAQAQAQARINKHIYVVSVIQWCREPCLKSASFHLTGQSDPSLSKQPKIQLGKKEFRNQTQKMLQEKFSPRKFVEK